MALGRVQTESKIEKEKRNENKQGVDWSLAQTCSPSFFWFRENRRFPPYSQNKKKLSAENRKANRKHEQQQFSVSYWSAQPRQDITSGLPYTAHNPQLARQHSRTDPP